MGFFGDVMSAFSNMRLPQNVVGFVCGVTKTPQTRQNMQPRGPAVRVTAASARMSRQDVVGRFGEWCVENIEPIPVANDVEMIELFTGSIEDFLNELEPWHLPYSSFYRDVLLDHGERNGYFWDYVMRRTA
jgi:hypothetical protein